MNDPNDTHLWCQGWILTSSSPDVKAEFWHHPDLMSRLNFDIIQTWCQGWIFDIILTWCQGWSFTSSKPDVNSEFWHHPDLLDEFQTWSWPSGWIQTSSKAEFWHHPDLMSRLNFWMQQEKFYRLWNVFFNDGIISGIVTSTNAKIKPEVNLVENNDNFYYIKYTDSDEVKAFIGLLHESSTWNEPSRSATSVQWYYRSTNFYNNNVNKQI